MLILLHRRTACHWQQWQDIFTPFSAVSAHKSTFSPLFALRALSRLTRSITDPTNPASRRSVTLASPRFLGFAFALPFSRSFGRDRRRGVSILTSYHRAFSGPWNVALDILCSFGTFLIRTHAWSLCLRYRGIPH